MPSHCETATNAIIGSPTVSTRRPPSGVIDISARNAARCRQASAATATAATMRTIPTLSGKKPACGPSAPQPVSRSRAPCTAIAPSTNTSDAKISSRRKRDSIGRDLQPVRASLHEPAFLGVELARRFLFLPHERDHLGRRQERAGLARALEIVLELRRVIDRKSTRLNS